MLSDKELLSAFHRQNFICWGLLTKRRQSCRLVNTVELQKKKEIGEGVNFSHKLFDIKSFRAESCWFCGGIFYIYNDHTLHFG